MNSCKHYMREENCIMKNYKGKMTAEKWPLEKIWCHWKIYNKNGRGKMDDQKLPTKVTYQNKPIKTVVTKIP